MPFKLLPQFKPYPWGDQRYIQELCGLEHLLGKPLAEMWLGAHPSASSELCTGGQTLPLYKAIDADPQAHLGSAIHIHDGQLPFLFKVLAAAKPLSIQLHPDKQTAIRGFAAENARGIALDDPRRTFKDDNHKPELICALTPFSMLCGFRPYGEIAGVLHTFALESILPEAAGFISNPAPESLKKLYNSVLRLSREDIAEILEHHVFSNHDIHPIPQQVIATCQALHQHFPADVGVLAPLFMNVVTLQPGEALAIRAGILHSYIHGVGLELMANSDNVVRGGLTDKHVDLDALFAIADFKSFLPQILTASLVNGMATYPSQTPEFRLGIITLDGDKELPGNDSPHIMLVLEGVVTIKNLGTLNKGEAAYFPAAESHILLSGKAKIAVAGIA